MEVEEHGGRGGGEAVGEEGEADDSDVLEGEVGAGEEVGEEVELVRAQPGGLGEVDGDGTWIYLPSSTASLRLRIA